MNNITFITGNQHKADYLTRQLGIEITHQKIDLDEIQSLNVREIVEHKLKQAYETVQHPVIVEDVSLGFTALNGLPGPYIKWFVENAGNETLCRMLDAFEDRSAEIISVFGYFDGKNIQFFERSCKGKISKEPRGTTGFGFDQIFVSEGYKITRSEMTQEDNEKHYADSIKPYGQLKEFIHSL